MVGISPYVSRSSWWPDHSHFLPLNHVFTGNIPTHSPGLQEEIVSCETLSQRKFCSERVRRPDVFDGISSSSMSTPPRERFIHFRVTFVTFVSGVDLLFRTFVVDVVDVLLEVYLRHTFLLERDGGVGDYGRLDSILTCGINTFPVWWRTETVTYVGIE